MTSADLNEIQSMIDVAIQDERMRIYELFYNKIYSNQIYPGMPDKEFYQELTNVFLV